MKQCPKCRQTYDDELNFCLSDGASLLALGDSEETTIRPFPISNLAQTVQLPVPSQTAVTPQPNKQRLLYGLVIVLAVLAAGSAVALFYERSRVDSKPPNNNQSSSIAVSPSISATPATNQTNENRKQYIMSACGSIFKTLEPDLNGLLALTTT